MKVIHKRRVRSRWEKTLRGAAITCIAGGAAIAATVFAIGWAGSIRVAEREKSGEIRPPPTTETASTRAAESLEDRRKAVVAIAKFLRAEHWRDLGPWVLKFDELRPLMEDWYSRHPRRPVSTFEVTGMQNRERDGRPLVLASVLVDAGGRRLFLVHKTAEGMKIDWKASVGYQPMDFEEFVTTRPTEPLEFLVRVRRGRSHIEPFDDPLKYRPYELDIAGYPKDRRRFYAYARGGTEADLMLAILLGFKRSSGAVVEVRFPQVEDGRPDVLEITGFLGADPIAR